jgi:hypothetical protein
MGCREIKRAVYMSKTYKCICSFLEMVSEGKYSSIFYLQNKNEKSSKIGGLLTLIWFSIVISYAYQELGSIFRMENWGLSQNTRTLAYYEVKPGGTIKNAKFINKKDWTVITVGQFVPLLKFS